jgi:hypothetical protein
MDPDPYPIPLLLLIDPAANASTYFLVGGILIILLLLSALLSGSEVAFFSLSADQRTSLRESEGASEKAVSHLLERPQQLLATLLIAINFVKMEDESDSRNFAKIRNYFQIKIDYLPENISDHIQ